MPSKMSDIVPPANSPGARLPPEVWADVVRLIYPTELWKFSQVNRTLRDLALSKEWENVNKGDRVASLFYFPLSIRQQLADRIRELHVSIRQECNFAGLTFPRLNRLHVYENGAQPGPLGFAMIDQSIQPELELLNLEEDTEWGDPGNGTVSNILPLLATRTPRLQELTLNIRMGNATSAQLLTALQACPLLKKFTLIGETQELMSAAVFKHLALVARLDFLAFGGEIDYLLLEDTVSGLPAHRNIFKHLSGSFMNVRASAAKHLFPRMEAMESMTLSISEPSDILTWVAEMPRLTDLNLKYIEDMPLNNRVLAGLQLMHLEALTISPGVGASIDGSAIKVDQLDYLFGSHQTLKRLSFAWEGSALLADIVSFLQYSLHLVIEKVAHFYPKVTQLCLLSPCASIDFLRTPETPLKTALETLYLDRIAEPAQSGPGSNYVRECEVIAEKIDLHCPNVANLVSKEDEHFTALVRHDVRDIHNMRYAMAWLGKDYLYLYGKYVLIQHSDPEEPVCDI